MIETEHRFNDLLAIPHLWGISFVLLAIILGSSYLQRSMTKKLIAPCLSDASQHDFRVAIKEGSTKYLNQAFTLATSAHLLVLLPTKYLPDIKAQPENKLSLNGELYHRFMGQYTSVGNNDEVLVASLLGGLTKNLPAVIEVLKDETIYAFNEYVPRSDDWTPFLVYPAILRVVALVSGRSFVGLPLCRDEEWIRTTIDFTLDAFNAGLAMGRYPAVLRPFVAPFVPAIKKVVADRAKAKQLVAPLIAKRLAEMRAEGVSFVRPKDMVQWILDNSRKEGRGEDLGYQAQVHLLTAFTAIHTTSMALTHTLYDLASHPEYIQPLREELEQVLREDNGTILKTSMARLKKMDSFIKESQRLSPPALVSMNRKVKADVKLSDGAVLTKGMYVAVASAQLGLDQDHWGNPAEFDGFRFLKLRQRAGEEDKHQFTTTSEYSMGFGYGSHSCPGRFFASSEIKVLLSHFLHNYDIKLREGDKRPENIFRQVTVFPDPNFSVLIRRRKLD